MMETDKEIRIGDIKNWYNETAFDVIDKLKGLLDQVPDENRDTAYFDIDSGTIYVGYYVPMTDDEIRTYIADEKAIIAGRIEEFNTRVNRDIAALLAEEIEFLSKDNK